MTEENQVMLEHYLQVRSCKIKAVFLDRAAAKKEAKRLTNAKRNGRIRAYKCRYCPNYHTGHNKYSKGKPEYA